MIVELPVAMLACARIGAIHSVVFGGYSADALCDRMIAGTPKVLITADGVMRGVKAIQLKKIADESLVLASKQGFDCPSMICVKRLGDGLSGDKAIQWTEGRDVWWHELME